MSLATDSGSKILLLCKTLAGGGVEEDRCRDITTSLRIVRNDIVSKIGIFSYVDQTY